MKRKLNLEGLCASHCSIHVQIYFLPFSWFVLFFIQLQMLEKKKIE